MAVSSNEDGGLIDNGRANGGASSYQRVGFDAFGPNRDQRVLNSFNFFRIGDSTSSAGLNSSNLRQLVIFDGSTKKILYNEPLPGVLSESFNDEVRAAVNQAGLSVEENFSSWAVEQISTEEDRGPDADPDGDDLVNLLEYAFGTDPTVVNPQPVFQIVGEIGALQLKFQQSTSANVTPIEILSGLRPDGVTPLTATRNVVPMGEFEEVTVDLPSELGDKYFFRLRATLPE